MANRLGILEWTNEHSLSNYPLSKPMSPMDFIVDASFVQFDGFIPVLKSITVQRTQLILALLTDAGEVKVTVAKPASTFFPGTSVTLESGNRYLGSLTFGQGLLTIFVNHLDAVLRPNIPFHPSVVKGISSKNGVYAIGGYSGDVEFTTGATPQTRALFYGVEGNMVTWNAGWLGTHLDRTPLKSLNNVLPVNNNVFIEDSDLIKVTPVGSNLDVSVILPLTGEVISPGQTFE